MIGLKIEIVGDTGKLDKTLDQTQAKVGGFGADIGGTALKVAGMATVAGAAALAIADSRAPPPRMRRNRGGSKRGYRRPARRPATTRHRSMRRSRPGRIAHSATIDARGAHVARDRDRGRHARDRRSFGGAGYRPLREREFFATAADAVAKAHAGQDGALRKLMPGLEKGATAADTLAAATAGAAGQADKYADSAQGLQERGADAFSEVGETIGSVFLPVIKELLPVK